MNLIKSLDKKTVLRFVRDVLIFLVLMLIVYLYLMYANLSTAPKFVYAQF